MFQFGKYNVDIIEMLSGHQAHQFKSLGLERQLQHQQQVQLHQHQLQQQQQPQVETPGAILSGLGLGPLQGSRSSAFSDSAPIFAKMSAPPPPLQQQSLSSSSQSSRKSSKMSGSSSSGGHVSGYPQFLRSFHPTEAALAQEQLHPGVGRFDHFAGGSGSGGSAGGIGLVSSVPPPPPPLHPGLSVPQASPGPSSSSPSPSSSSSNNPTSSSTVTSLGHQLTGAQSDARSLHQQFSCMLAANQYFLSGVPANSSLEQFLVQQGSHNHLGLGLGQSGSESSSGLAPPPALHSSHTHSHSTTLQQPQQPAAQQQQLPPHSLSHPHPHPHHPLHSTSQPSSLGGFDFQGIPVLSSNQLASLMQQEAGLALPLPLHLSLSKDEGKGDSTTGGSGGGRRKKAMAGYLPQRKTDNSGNSSSSHSSANPNPSSSTSGVLSQDTVSGRIGMSGMGRDPSSHLISSSSSVVSSSSSSAPTSTSASVLVSNSSKTDNHSSMTPRSSQPEPEPLYHCGECGKTFTHLSSLRRHLRSHELTTAGTAGTRSNVINPVLHPADPSIPHSTQDSSSSSLCQSPDKTFHCSDCGKGFKKKGHLLQHGVIHSGARPFACSTCSRAFNRRESLTRHEKIHEEKPFRCPACGRCFRESTSLLNHAASGTCGKSGRGPRQKSDSSNSVVGGKSSKTGSSSDGMVTSAVGAYRNDGYNNFKDQRSQGNLYPGASSCGGGISGPSLRKAPLAPTLHPHPQSQNQQHHHQQTHLPLSSLLDDSEDDVTSSVNNAISAITAAAANCITGDLNNSSSRGDDRRDIIGGLLGGLGLGPLNSPGGPSSTSGMEKSFRSGETQDSLALHQQANQQAQGGKPKRPRKPRKKKEPGSAGSEPPKRRQSSLRTGGGIGDIRPYLCSICGRGFARRETLRRHDRIHTGEKPHHCTVCGKYFREAFHLSKHHTVHSGEKNYKCLLCGKDFGYAQSLKRHGKLHQKGEIEEVPTTPGGENFGNYPTPGGSMAQGGQSSSSFYPYPQDVKPQGPNPQPPPRLYTCAICWKSFRHHFHLTAHHQTVHEGGGDKLFSCEVCGKAFAYSNSLTRHRLSQHGLTRSGQGAPQGSASVTGEDSHIGGSVSESEAATNALLQLAPTGGGHEEEDSHSGVLHSHQHAPPQPQAGYSPLFYIPDANTPLPSSSNTTPYSQSVPSSSSMTSHQHTGVKGEPVYQASQRHILNPNLPVHPLALPPPEQHQHHSHPQQHQANVHPHHHHSFHTEEDLRRRKKKKKRRDEREKIGYGWSQTARVERDLMDLSGGERRRNETRRLQRKMRRVFRRRQRKFRRKMAMLLRIRRNGGGSRVVCELSSGGLELYRLLSFQVPLKRFPCPFCFLTTFSRRAALMVHIAARHCPRFSYPSGRLRCAVCGKQSRKLLSALIHRSSHLSNRAFSCKRCPSRFWNAALLTRHKRTCRGKLTELSQRRALCLKLTTGTILKRGDCKDSISTLQIQYSH